MERLEGCIKRISDYIEYHLSSRSSLNKEVVYDYLIMDEASQVDVATGALALSCAKNVIIVGDTKQLPNVVPDDIGNKPRQFMIRLKLIKDMHTIIVF